MIQNILDSADRFDKQGRADIADQLDSLASKLVRFSQQQPVMLRNNPSARETAKTENQLWLTVYNTLNSGMKQIWNLNAQQTAFLVKQIEAGKIEATDAKLTPEMIGQRINLAQELAAQMQMIIYQTGNDRSNPAFYLATNTLEVLQAWQPQNIDPQLASREVQQLIQSLHQAEQLATSQTSTSVDRWTTQVEKGRGKAPILQDTGIRGRSKPLPPAVQNIMNKHQGDPQAQTAIREVMETMNPGMF